MASDPGPKPQRLGIKIFFKNCTSDKLQTFKTIFWDFLETSDQNLFILFQSAILAREITEPLRKIKTSINGLRENILH